MTTYPVGYNPTFIPISGASQLGDLVIGESDFEWSLQPEGITFWMSPSDTIGYIIAHPTPSGNQPNPLGIPAYVGFWRSEFKTDESFIQLSEWVSNYHGTPQTFSTSTQAKTWLNDNGYWTSYVPAATPTPTPTITQTPTPSITASQTMTPTNTNTPTPSITASQTPTTTPTVTQTPTNTSTVTQTPTRTPTPTSTPPPPVVSSGLELYYDPSNPSSYPGSGTILYDLSPSGANGTIGGSPALSGNAFVFTGSQNILSGNLFGLFAGWQHTLEIWVNPSIVSQVFSDTSSSSVTSGYHASGLEFYTVGPFVISNMMLWNGTNVTRVGGGTTPLNAWYQYVRVYNGSNTAYAYVNKVKSSDTSITWVTPSPAWYLNFGLSDTTAFSTSVRFQGKLGVIRLYNRVLSQSEITQNFDATKSKYGL